MKKLIALLLVLVMAIGMVACGGEGEKAPGGDAKEGLKVAISVAEYNEWNKLYEGVIKEKCEEWGWTYEIFDSKQDANTQIDQVRSIISQGFDAMTIQAVDMAALGTPTALTSTVSGLPFPTIPRCRISGSTIWHCISP